MWRNAATTLTFLLPFHVSDVTGGKLELIFNGGEREVGSDVGLCSDRMCVVLISKRSSCAQDAEPLPVPSAHGAAVGDP